MADNLEILNKIIEEHRLIHDNITAVSEKANDVNAQVLLDWERSDLAVSGPEAMDVKVETLKKSVSSLQVNLGRHFFYEETYLPPVLGAELMNILLIDHKAIRSTLEIAADRLSTFSAAEIPAKELLDKKMDLISVISDVTDLIKEHSLKEDTILRGKKKELESTK